MAPTRPPNTTVGVMTSALTMPLATVAATESEMNTPTKFRIAAMVTATLGGSAPVAIVVAIAFAVSWKPLVKSKPRAATTTRATMMSAVTRRTLDQDAGDDQSRSQVLHNSGPGRTQLALGWRRYAGAWRTTEEIDRRVALRAHRQSRRMPLDAPEQVNALLLDFLAEGAQAAFSPGSATGGTGGSWARIHSSAWPRPTRPRSRRLRSASETVGRRAPTRRPSCSCVSGSDRTMPSAETRPRRSARCHRSRCRRSSTRGRWLSAARWRPAGRARARGRRGPSRAPGTRRCAARSGGRGQAGARARGPPTAARGRERLPGSRRPGRAGRPGQQFGAEGL